MRARSIILYPVIVLLALLAMVSVAGYVYLMRGPGREFLRTTAESRLSDMLEGRVSIGSLETNLFTYIELSDVVATRGTGPGGHPFLSLGMAYIGYDLGDLLRLRLRLTRVNIGGLAVSVFRDSTGAFPTMPRPPSDDTPENDTGPSRFIIRLDELSLTGASLRYNDRSIPFEALVEEVSADVRSLPGGGHSFDIGTGNGRYEYDGSELTSSDIHASGSLNGEGLVLDTAGVTMPGLTIEGRGTVGLSSSPVSLDVTMSSSGDAETIAGRFKSLIPRRLLPLTGGFEAEFTITGTTADPAVSGTVTSPSLDIGGVGISDLKAELAYSDSGIAINDLTLRTHGGRVSARGVMHLDSLRNHTLELTAGKMDLTALLETLHGRKTSYSGSITADVTSKGPLTDIMNTEASAVITIHNAAFDGESFDDIEADAGFRAGDMTVAIRQGDSELTGEGSLTGETVDGSFTGHWQGVEPLLRLARIRDIDGDITLEGTVSGRMSRPDVRLTATGRDIRYRTFLFDTVDGGLSYTDGELIIDPTSFTGGMTFGDSTVAAPVDIPGLVATLHYEGSIERTPEGSFRGSASGRMEDIAWRGTAFPSGTFTASLDSTVIKLDPLTLDHGDSLSVHAEGRFDFGRMTGEASLRLDNDGEPEGEVNMSAASGEHGWTIHVRGGKLDVQALGSIHPIPAVTDGTLDFRWSAHGVPRFDGMSLESTLSAPVINGITLDTVSVSASLSDTVLTVDELRAGRDGSFLTGHGDMQISRGDNGRPVLAENPLISGSLDGDDIELPVILGAILEETEVSGLVDVHLSWDGTLRDPALRGSLGLGDGMVRFSPDSPPVEDIMLNAGIDEGSILDIEELSGRVGSASFLVTGTVATRKGERYKTDLAMTINDTDVLKATGEYGDDDLNLTVNMWDFRIGVLEALLPGISDLDGTMTSTVTVNGPPTSPDLSGDLRVDGLRFKHTYINRMFTGGEAVVSFDRESVTLDSLHLNQKEGHVDALGSLTITGGGIGDISLRTDMADLKLDRPGEYDIRLKKGDLTFSDTGDGYRLSGGFEFETGRYTKDISLNTLLSLIRSQPKTVRDPSQMLRDTSLDIRISDTDDIWIDNNMARFRFQPEVTVTGNAAHPVLNGRVTVLEGYILYLDRKFEVKQGVFDFIDPNRINPLVDIRAEASVRSYLSADEMPYNISLVVNGRADDAQVSLTSTPALAETDIISLLTLGATRQELAGANGQGGLTTSELMQRRVESYSSQTISYFVGRRLGRLLGIDDISIQGNLFNYGKSWGPQLVASDRVTDRMEITYSTTAGETNRQSIRLDYRLSDWFSVQGETDQEGNAGLDLKYRWRFK